MALMRAFRPENHRHLPGWPKAVLRSENGNQGNDLGGNGSRFSAAANILISFRTRGQRPGPQSPLPSLLATAAGDTIIWSGGSADADRLVVENE